MNQTQFDRRCVGGLRRALAVVMTLGLVAAACGGDDDTSDDVPAEQPDAGSGDDAGGDDSADDAGGDDSADDAGGDDSADDAGGDDSADDAGGDDSADDAGGDDSADDADGEQPVAGGEITISESFALSLDPTIGVPYGCCGGQALAAIYDTIVTYNWETRVWDMQTAESLEPNDDLTVWTLTLKPGITFTDGSPYNAEAVVINIERHRAQPRSQHFADTGRFIDTVEAIDDLTVVFTLNTGWAEFPEVLAGGGGMIANPAVIEAQGENFGLEPGDMGAGAFKVESFTANEQTVLVRNDNYWGGEVYLDRITSIAGTSGQSINDSITGGTFDGGATVLWPDVARAAELNYPSVEMTYPSGLVILMNSGTYKCASGVPASVCDGVADGEIVQMDTATADPRVRKAVMHAIDRDLWNDRFYDGTAIMSDRVFSETLSFSPDVLEPGYDPDAAAALVEEAKADGWDGTIRLVGSDDPNETQGQQTFAAMLEAVGMTPELDLRPQSEYRAVIQTDRDFDVYAGAWGFGNSEDRYYTQVSGNLQNYSYGYDSPEMNAALDGVRVAAGADREAAWAALAEVIAADNPVGFIGTAPRHFIYSPNLRGLQTTGNTIILFDEAWLAS